MSTRDSSYAIVIFGILQLILDQIFESFPLLC